jgi:hypothetical protein
MSPNSASVSALQQSATQEVSAKTKYGYAEVNDSPAPVAKILPEQQPADDTVNGSIYLNGWI